MESNSKPPSRITISFQPLQVATMGPGNPGGDRQAQATVTAASAGGIETLKWH